MEQIKNIHSKQKSKFSIFNTVLVLFTIFVVLNYNLLSETDTNNLPLFQNNGKAQSFFIILLSIITPLLIIVSKIVFLQFIEFIFSSISSSNIQTKILIATISYIPILLGSTLNYFCIQWFGDRKHGYTTLYSYLENIENSFLILITSLVNPFELLSVLLLIYVYLKWTNKDKNLFFIFILLYYGMTIFLSILFEGDL